MKEHSMWLMLLALVVTVAFPANSLAAGKTLKPIGYESPFEDNKLHPTAEAACLGWANTPASKEAKVKISGPPQFDLGGVVCTHTVDGAESYGGIYVYILCPENSSALSLNLCACHDDSYAVENNQCVGEGEKSEGEAQVGSHDALSEPVVKTTQPTSQDHDPQGCGLSKEQYDALSEVLGKKFSNVSYLNDVWTAAVAIQPGLQSNVATLQRSNEGNQGNRKFFDTARNNFWDILAGRNAIRKKFEKSNPKIDFPESAVAKARATFAKAGITFPVNEGTSKKRAALITINGKEQQIDIDHIVGFAEVPNKMIDPSNLQLSPEKENRYALEEIARKDIFYDPAAYLEAERQKMITNDAGCPVQ